MAEKPESFMLAGRPNCTAVHESGLPCTRKVHGKGQGVHLFRQDGGKQAFVWNDETTLPDKEEPDAAE